MSFSDAFASCYQYQAPVRLDLIAATCRSLVMMGDLTYSDGNVGTVGNGSAGSGFPFNGDAVDGRRWCVPTATLTLTVGAATTANGVAGQLPLGLCTVPGAPQAVGWPASDVITVMLQQQSNGFQGGAVATITTNASGQVTQANIMTPGKGYTNGGGATFVTYNEPWSQGYDLRRVNQLLTLPEWNWFSTRRATLGPDGKGVEWLYMPDDHDHGGNNFDFNSAAKAAGGSGITGINTAADMLNYVRMIVPGLRAVHSRWFDNVPVVGGNGDLPQGLVGAVGTGGAASGADLDVRYFSRYRDANGRIIGKHADAGTPVICQIFLDSIFYKSFQTTADTAAKTMLGATQKAWLKATMLAAVAAGCKAVWIMSGKDLCNRDNSDGWGVPSTVHSGGWTSLPYITERDEILSYIQTNNIPAVWMTGDRHAAHVSYSSLKQPLASGTAAEHIAVCACPFGSVQGTPNVFDSGSTPYPEMLWQHQGRDQMVYGKITWNDALQQTEMAVLDNCDDTEQFWCAVSAGARIPLPSQIRTLRPIAN